MIAPETQTCSHTTINWNLLAILPCQYCKINKFLQSEDPIIPVIWDQANSFVKKLVGKFVMVELIKKAVSDHISWL